MPDLRYFAFVEGSSTERTSTPDELVLYVGFADHDDLVGVLDKLGILTHGDGVAPSVIATAGPRNSHVFPDLVEPGDCTLASVACHVDINTTTLTIALPGAHTAAATQIEAAIDRLGLGARISRPR